MKIAETHKKYLDDCGEGVYKPTPAISVVERGRVFDLSFDNDLTDEQKALGQRKIDMTTRLCLPEALGLFKEINKVTYEAFDLALVTHNAYGGALMRKGGEEKGMAGGVGDCRYRINMDIIDQIVAAGLRLEAVGSSNMFSPEYIAVPNSGEGRLEIQRMWGKDPALKTVNQIVEAYFLTCAVTTGPNATEEHTQRLEEAVKKWKVEGDNPVGRGIDFHRK